jgi:hypothetical protein
VRLGKILEIRTVSLHGATITKATSRERRSYGCGKLGDVVRHIRKLAAAPLATSPDAACRDQDAFAASFKDTFPWCGKSAANVLHHDQDAERAAVSHPFKTGPSVANC